MKKHDGNTQSQKSNVWRNILLKGFFLVLLVLRPIWAEALPFDSGSTGVDGPFSPTIDTALPLPPDGILNFTTVNIPAGVEVTFTRNTANTPVTILASGDITIDGTFNLDGQDGSPGDSTSVGSVGVGGDGGPGGYRGGGGGLAPPWNGGNQGSYGQGLGPGIQATGNSCPANFRTFPIASSNCNGPIYGTITLLPLIGGSGGNGGASTNVSTLPCPLNGCNGGGGGGGGGAILIASSGIININGTISANGGNSGSGLQAGGPGSGGGIRLIADTIAGNGTIRAQGGGPSPQTGWRGGEGRIRIEAKDFTFSGSILSGSTISTPGLVNLSVIPTLSITAIAGVPVPSTASGLFDSPDITLPSSTPFPQSVDLTATNIPVGTVVSVINNQRHGFRTIATSSLSGTDVSSTATVTVGLNSLSPYVMRVEATFAVQTAANYFPAFAEGEKVEKIKVASIVGGTSSVFLITETGKEVPWP